MPRMSKKRRLEWSFFLNHRNRITYNDLCRGCTRDCKQSFRAVIILCPRYYSKRWKKEDAAYGRYHNVILSDTELDGLKTELPGKWEYYIDRLSCHIASSGRKYKSHAATIFKWAQEDAAKKAPKKGIPDYTCKEGESL